MLNLSHQKASAVIQITEEELSKFPWDIGKPSNVAYRDMDRAIYDSIDAANYSRLKVMHSRSPLHVIDSDDKRTKALSLGDIAHTKILEPDRAKRDLLILPEIGAQNTNRGRAELVDALADALGIDVPWSAGKSEKDRLEDQIKKLRLIVAERGLTEVSSDQNYAATKMYDSVMRHPAIGAFLGDFDAEVVAVNADPETGVLCKVRIDALPIGHVPMVDLKTADSAAADDFRRAIRRYYYDLQGELYPRIFHVTTGELRPWVWAVVESERPWACQAFFPDHDTRVRGRRRLDEALRTWSQCLETGIWPPYQTGIAPI